MRVRAVVSFSGFVNGELQAWPVGQEAELPEGVDWQRLGWVVAVEEPPAVETEAPPAPKSKARKPKPDAPQDGGDGA